MAYKVNDLEENNSEDKGNSEELTTEIWESGLFAHFRYRDSRGRFASQYQDPQRKKELEADRKLEKFIKDYRKKVSLPQRESMLLLRLVNNFQDRKLLDKRGFLNPKVHQFKRIPYHDVLMSCRMKRSNFSQFVSKMVNRGLIRKIKHGRKLYLRITEKGLDKVFMYWEEYG